MPKHSKLLAPTTLILIVSLAACSSTRIPSHASMPPNTDTLQGLQALGKMGQKAIKAPTANIRVLAIKETAYTIGAQAGLANRAKYINSYLLRHTRRLDKIYEFSTLMLENNVLPPVLSEGQNTFNLANVNTIRISDRTYKIQKQARFVTTPPNWRQYLWMDYRLPEAPHSSVLPRDNEEQQAWVRYTYEGWQKGIEQADTIFSDNLARLKGDFLGMLLYRKLLAMNMVSPPYVAHTELGITGDNNQINIDDKVLRIVALPKLQPNSKEWRASVSKLDDQLSQLRKMEKLASKATIEITDQVWQPVIPPLE